MIVFRHADPRFPFLWEGANEPPARWHAMGEGPVHYFAETADGAWAEFLRHGGITDPADLVGVGRSIWAIALPRLPRTRPSLAGAVLAGDESSYDACRREARRLRARGARGLIAPSAAIDARYPEWVPHGSRPAPGAPPGRARLRAVRTPPGNRRMGGLRGGSAAR